MDASTAQFFCGLSLLILIWGNKLITRYFLRHIRVTLIIDTDCVIDTSWDCISTRTTRIIREASRIFEKEFAITFSVSEIRLCKVRTSMIKIENYFTYLHITQKEFDSDISIFITSKSIWDTKGIENGSYIYKEIAGYGHEDGAVIIRLFPWNDINVLIATHELAHLFFAPHCIDDETSIMHPSHQAPDATTTRLAPVSHTFDRDSKQFILWHKFRPFSKNFFC